MTSLQNIDKRHHDESLNKKEKGLDHSVYLHLLRRCDNKVSGARYGVPDLVQNADSRCICIGLDSAKLRF
jgi:hypothetical protein